jgi:ADP-ribose pyrophosphatase YjhB (NUDIX family)
LEVWDGYFEDGTLANQDLIRGEQIPKGLYHLVCDILVRHIDGDYLLMQRDFCKSNYGGYFEATAGGSVLKGEDIWECARRELLEETGIESDCFQLIGSYASCDTIYYSFLCVTQCDKTSITLQEGETVSYKWVSEKEFIEFINSSEMISIQKERYSDYFRKMRYIYR